jgi:hypothetical protein
MADHTKELDLMACVQVIEEGTRLVNAKVVVGSRKMREGSHSWERPARYVVVSKEN